MKNFYAFLVVLVAVVVGVWLGVRVMAVAGVVAWVAALLWGLVCYAKGLR